MIVRDSTVPARDSLLERSLQMTGCRPMLPFALCFSDPLAA